MTKFRLRPGAELPKTRPVDDPRHDPSCPHAYKGDDNAPCSCTFTASLVHENPAEGSFEVAIYRDGTIVHDIQYGGQGDGFCYLHQSFECQLTPEEQAVVDDV